jgi:hypothetical protein
MSYEYFSDRLYYLLSFVIVTCQYCLEQNNILLNDVKGQNNIVLNSNGDARIKLLEQQVLHFE